MDFNEEIPRLGAEIEALKQRVKDLERLSKPRSSAGLPLDEARLSKDKPKAR